MLIRKKLLLIEDNESDRGALLHILSPRYDVLPVWDERGALDALELFGDEIVLILLDMTAPDQRGDRFLTILKAREQYSSVPILVMTGGNGDEAIHALSREAADFIVKPFRPEIVLHRVANLISLRESSSLATLARYDQLTNLLKKDFFFQRVQEVMLQNPERKYDLIASNVENFTLTNDVFGKQVGDRVLQSIAQCYLLDLGERGVCGRIEADHFFCLVPHRDNYLQSDFAAFLEVIRKHCKVDNLVMKWGVYPITSPSIPVSTICDRAFLAAESVKGQYEKHFAYYDEALRERLLLEQSITSGMEAALAGGQIKVFFQPKYRIRDGRLAGAEALVRWFHPRHGIYYPSDFIPIFEQNGFITKMDQFVWRSACASLRDWEKRGLPPISLSVNVSRADIYNSDIVQTMTDLAEEYGLSPARLHLEITESVYTENPQKIIETVNALRQLGFIVEMDDFGSGYSSLNMLNDLTIDVLKLDKRFIQSEIAKPVDQGILRFVVELARWLNLSVVAEGVETKEQLERLHDVSCDYVQGFYFSKPLPAEEFEILLAGSEVMDESAWFKFPQPIMSNRTVLLAEENDDFRNELEQTFSPYFHLKSVRSAEQVLEFLREHRQETLAVLLSLTLPDTDTYELIRTIKRDRELWEVPVVACAPWSPETEFEALNQGAEVFIARPCRMESLVKRFRTTLRFIAFRAQEQELRTAATRDYLTGMLNRRGLREAVDNITPAGPPMAVYLFGMDNLKVINDSLGHAAGDNVLKYFCRVLQAQTRSDDIIAYFGGDKFVAVLKTPSPEFALKKGELICEATRGGAPAPGLYVSCSGGVAMLANGEPLIDAIDRADRALQESKASHRGGCTMWHA